MWLYHAKCEKMNIERISQTDSEFMVSHTALTSHHRILTPLSSSTSPPTIQQKNQHQTLFLTPELISIQVSQDDQQVLNII